MDEINLVKSNKLNVYEVSMQQFLKCCVSQNFISGPNYILGRKPRIICVDVETQTKVPINYYMPLHKNFFMYFGKYMKITNRQRLENFIKFVLNNDIYLYESNINNGISVTNVREHLKEILLDQSRVVIVYMLNDCFVELLNVDSSEFVSRKFYNDGFNEYYSSKTMKVPLFFNIVEKNQKINIIGILDQSKLNNFRMTHDDKYKFVKANTLEYFRQIVIKPIGDIFYYCPYVIPRSKLQYELLCQLYHIKSYNELMFYRYMFLLNSKTVSRKCLYPLNFEIFERVDINDLTNEEVTLLSDYYMIPVAKLRNNHIHFMPIEEVGRSLLIMDEDVLLHKYTTDPPNAQDCITQYVYVEKE